MTALHRATKCAQYAGAWHGAATPYQTPLGNEPDVEVRMPETASILQIERIEGEGKAPTHTPVDLLVDTHTAAEPSCSSR